VRAGAERLQLRDERIGIGVTLGGLLGEQSHDDGRKSWRRVRTRARNRHRLLRDLCREQLLR